MRALEWHPSGWKELDAVPRPTSSLIAFWVLTAFVAVLVGDAALQGDWRLFALALAPGLFVVWAGWLFIYRPEVRFDTTRAVLVNPGRTHVIPWQRVEEVQQRLQIVLELDSGRRLTAWGSPFPEKPGLRRPVPGERRRQVPGSELASALEASRTRVVGREQPPQATSTWDLLPLGIGAVLLVISLVEVLIAF